MLYELKQETMKPWTETMDCFNPQRLIIHKMEVGGQKDTTVCPNAFVAFTLQIRTWCFRLFVIENEPKTSESDNQSGNQRGTGFVDAFSSPSKTKSTDSGPLHLKAEWGCNLIIQTATMYDGKQFYKETCPKKWCTSMLGLRPGW